MKKNRFSYHKSGKIAGVLSIITFLAVLSPIFHFAEAFTKDSDGWTIFTPSEDSKIVYVSTTVGNDNTARAYTTASPEIGSNPRKPVGAIKPFKTYAAARKEVASGSPDWILFKRGDTFTEQLNPQSGRGEDEYHLYSDYGKTGPSPLIMPGESRAVFTNGTVQYFAIQGIDFYAHTRDPHSPNYVSGSGNIGLNIMCGGSGSIKNFLIEGCTFRFFRNNTIQDLGTGTITGLTIRRCLFLDNYMDGEHSQGLYTKGVSMLLEENIFDHNGWYSQAGTGGVGEATVFNHNTYFAQAYDTTFRNNIFLRSSSIQNKWTANEGAASSSNIVIDNNLYVDGEVGISIGGNVETPLKFKNITIINNLLINIGRSRPTGRTLGWGIDIIDWNGGTVSDNYILHNYNSNVNDTYGFFTNGTSRNVTVSNNVVYGLAGKGFKIGSRGTRANFVISNNLFQEPIEGDYFVYGVDGISGLIFSNNKFYSDRTSNDLFYVNGAKYSLSSWRVLSGDNSVFQEYSFPNPTRSIERYQASLGKTTTIDAFIKACRAQNRYNWDKKYTAEAVNSWIKAGFSHEADSPNISAPINVRIIGN